MSEELDPLVARVAAVLKAEPDFGAGFDRRVMDAVRAEPLPGTVSAWWASLRRPREMSISPLGALAMAAGLAALVLGSAITVSSWRFGVEQGAGGVASGGGADLRPVQFVLVMPAARTVTLVGDFNDWEPDGLPMQRSAAEGVWSVTLPLAPGRYRYSFVVDGTRWYADPGAPRAIEDDFGRPNSILTVGEQGS